ncbi:molybdopterin-dependent oxidoreductase [Paenirhodobacter sp.]|uniref:molybdopterin-dependent oxidoreductase n=1 Tax=Paenirhodobacter sp. TaxID=1965326 RepID=UPI003B3E34E1
MAQGSEAAFAALLAEPAAGQVGTHWGFYRHDGRAESLRPAPSDPDPAGFAADLPAARLAPCRILRPAVRQSFLENGPGHGRRGAERFVEVSWDEAERLAAGEIARIRDRWGPEALYSGCYGWSSAGRFHHAQSQVKRFFNAIGGSVRSTQTYSYAAGEVLLPHVIGSTAGMVSGHSSWQQIRAAEVILAFGGVPLRNAQVNAGGALRHGARAGMEGLGRRFINISPVQDDLDGAFMADWLPIVPGSDTALILALCHHVIVSGRADHGFLRRYTTGAEGAIRYILGESDGTPKTSAWAATLTGIAPDRIDGLARLICEKRTFLMMAWALQRADHGEQPYWALITLAALLGGIGLPGQGFGFGYASVDSIGARRPPVHWPSVPQGTNPVSLSIPVARITDMLLHPGAHYLHDGAEKTYPHVRLVYWAGGNPFHHHQDLNRLNEAWQRPETVIVHEHFWNALARRADIVFPVATAFERDDLTATGRDAFLALSRRAAEPPEGVPTDFEILRRIAARLGAEAAFTGGLGAADWLARLYDQARGAAAQAGVTLPEAEAFIAAGVAEPEPQGEDLPFLAEFRADPEAHPLRTPSGRIELASERIRGFGLKDCPGHAAWIAPGEWLAAAGRWPLHLLTCQPSDKLHSQWDHAAPSQRTKAGGRQPVRINPADAQARGVQSGDLVRVFNDRGACLAVADVTPALRPGVVQIATGAWFDPLDPALPGSLEVNGNPNVLTPDHGASTLSQGPSPNSCLVEIAPFPGPVPPVTIYDRLDLAPDSGRRPMKADSR